MVGLGSLATNQQAMDHKRNLDLRAGLRADENLRMQGRQADLQEKAGLQGLARGELGMKKTRQDMEMQLQDRVIKATSMLSDQIGGLATIEDEQQYKQGLDMVYRSPVAKLVDPDRELYEFFSNRENAKTVMPALAGLSAINKQKMDREDQALRMQKGLAYIESAKNGLMGRKGATERLADRILEAKKRGDESGDYTEYETLLNTAKIQKLNTGQRIDPATGKVTTMQGFSESMADIEGAKEGVKTDNKRVQGLDKEITTVTSELTDFQANFPTMVENLDRAIQLADKLPFGLLEEGAQAVAGAAGVETDSMVAKSEFNSILKNQIFPLLKSTFGAVVTDSEREGLLSTIEGEGGPRAKIQTIKTFVQQKAKEIEAKSLQLDKLKGERENLLSPRRSDLATPVQDSDPLGLF